MRRRHPDHATGLAGLLVVAMDVLTGALLAVFLVLEGAVPGQGG